MVKTQLDMFVEILKEAKTPKRRSSINAAFDHGNRRLDRHLFPLVSKDYLTCNGDSSNPMYQSTERAIRAIDAYDRLALELGFTYEHGIRESDLAVLREFGKDNYKAKVDRRTVDRIRQRLLDEDFVKDGQLTERGRTMLEQGKDLFDLADCVLSI